jgi:hypothetical protein
MAQLHVTPRAGLLCSGWSITSESPAALAAIPDSIVQLQGLAADSMTVWATHPSEQDGLRSSAYTTEISELGPECRVDVVELVRPRQERVVWIDRYQLVAGGSRAERASRIAGLYAGSAGTCAIWVHHPSVSAGIESHAAGVARTVGDGWADEQITLQCRFVALVSGSRSTVEVRCPPASAPAVLQALDQLGRVVAHW